MPTADLPPSAEYRSVGTVLAFTLAFFIPLGLFASIIAVPLAHLLSGEAETAAVIATYGCALAVSLWLASS